MKVTIELTITEVAGIKAYLGDMGEQYDKNGIKVFIQSIVQTTINNPNEAVCDYIQQQIQKATD